MASGADSTVGRLRGGGRGWTLVAVAMGWLLILGGRYLVPAVLPQVKVAFGQGNTGGGIAVSIIWATYGLAQSPAGILSDRLGERVLLAVSLLLSGLSLVVLGLAPVFLAFLGGCAAFGIASGLYGPARGTVLTRTFPTDANTAIGVTLAAGSVGSAVVPLAAGAIVQTVGWEYVLGGLAPPLVLGAWFAWWAVPDRESGARPDPTPGHLLRDVAAAIGTRRVALASVAITLIVFVLQALTTFYVTYLVEIREIDQRIAAGMLALVFVGGAASQVLAGYVADRIGSPNVLAGIAIVGAVTVGAIPFVHGIVPLGLLSLLVGSRLAIAPVSNAYIIGALPEDVTGTAWGLIRAGFFFLGATGSTVVGIMADADMFDGAFLLLAGLTAVAALLYLLLPSDRSAAG